MLTIPKHEVPKTSKNTNHEKSDSNNESLAGETVKGILALGDKNGIGIFANLLSKLAPDIRNADNVEFDNKTTEINNMREEISGIATEIPSEIESITAHINKYFSDISFDVAEVKHFIGKGIAEEGKEWAYSEDGQELYKEYFDNLERLYQDNAEEIEKIQEKRAEYEKELQEQTNQSQKEALEQSHEVERQAVKEQNEELIKTDEDLFAEQLAQRIEASNKMGDIETQKADEILQAKTSATLEHIGVDEILIQNNKKIEQSEADSHKTRIDQWKEYAEKVSAISQQVSEITGMVTNSLGGMFSQLSASYAQELESLNEKIAAVDEEKEAALGRVALSEDQRRAREEELAQQKINLEYATSEEQIAAL